MSIKNSSDSTGNRTRDFSACSAVPQPTALPRAPVENSCLPIHLFAKYWLVVTENINSFDDRYTNGDVSYKVQNTRTVRIKTFTEVDRRLRSYGLQRRVF